MNGIVKPACACSSRFTAPLCPRYLLEGHRAHEGRDHEREHAQHRDPASAPESGSAR